MTASPLGNTSSPRRRFGRWLLLSLAVLVALVAAGALIWEPATDVVSQGTPQAHVPAVADDSTAVPERIIVYYFHTTYRCVSCRNIEKYTREALESGFSGDLEGGHLVWRVVNVEEEGNEHFVKDYQLFTKSVVLVDEHTGEWKNLPKVWQLLGNPDKFIDYIQIETEDFLRGKHS